MKKVLYRILITGIISISLASCTVESNDSNTHANNNNSATQQDNVLPTQVNLSKNSFECFSGNSGIIKASVLPNTANQTVTWSSSNSSIIEIYNGTWYANAIGTATLIATAINGVQGICRVNVIEAFKDRLDKGGTSTATTNYTVCTVRLDDYSFDFTYRGNTATVDFKFVKVTVTSIVITEYGQSYNYNPVDAGVDMFVNILDKNSNIVVKEALAFHPSPYSYVNQSYSGVGRKIVFDFSSSSAPYSMVLTNHRY